jgi:hypothetical protein
MENIEARDSSKSTFFNHVFSTSEDSKAEILNTLQYAIFAIIPLVILNKTIQKFLPDPDPEKSTLEITLEILIQIIVIFIGIVITHRVITYFPTYSGFKYGHLELTGAVLTFLIVVLSIQTKMGLKVNILVERLDDMWNGTTPPPKVRESKQQPRQDSQEGGNNPIFPPTPVSTTHGTDTYDQMMRGNLDSGPAPANTLLGSMFGSIF